MWLGLLVLQRFRGVDTAPLPALERGAIMEWLTDNPIANMYGSHFLLLYGIVIVATTILFAMSPGPRRGGGD